VAESWHFGSFDDLASHVSALPVKDIINMSRFIRSGLVEADIETTVIVPPKIKEGGEVIRKFDVAWIISGFLHEFVPIFFSDRQGIVILEDLFHGLAISVENIDFILRRHAPDQAAISRRKKPDLRSDGIEVRILGDLDGEQGPDLLHFGGEFNQLGYRLVRDHSGLDSEYPAARILAGPFETDRTGSRYSPQEFSFQSKIMKAFAPGVVDQDLPGWGEREVADAPDFAGSLPLLSDGTEKFSIWTKDLYLDGLPVGNVNQAVVSYGNVSRILQGDYQRRSLCTYSKFLFKNEFGLGFRRGFFPVPDHDESFLGRDLSLPEEQHSVHSGSGSRQGDKKSRNQRKKTD